MPEPPDRWAQRLEQVQRLTDEEFAGEVRQHQQSRWRQKSLEQHELKHRRHFASVTGRAPSVAELDRLSHEILVSWDRLFTERSSNGTVTYDFVRLLEQENSAIIVVTGGGLIRSSFPTRSLTLRLRRKPGLVEVTDRAKRIKLAH